MSAWDLGEPDYEPAWKCPDCDIVISDEEAEEMMQRQEEDEDDE